MSGDDWGAHGPPRFEVRILGPLEVAWGDRTVAVRGQKLRRLLAVLALGNGRLTSVDAIVDALWGERPPDGAVGTVQSHVSHLRRLLAATGMPDASGRLVSSGSGYILALGSDELDAGRFERLLERGRTARSRGDEEGAVTTFRDALSLWRGPALAELASEPFALPAAVTLEELRLVALEALVEAELSLGRHDLILPEVDALARQHPLRERFSAQLMTALYRSGRQGDALRAYQHLRAVLAEEVGVDPSPQLQELERKILVQSAELDWAEDRDRPRPDGDVRRGAADLFVGRETELAALEEWLADAVGGRARCVLVAGEAGIGKSALLRVFAERARARGVPVHWGRCWEEQGAPPFWPWDEIVASVRSTRGDAEPDGGPLAQLFASVEPPGSPSARPAASSLVADDVRLEAFQAVASLLRDGGPTAVILEDLHEADASSLQLLRFLLPRITAAPLLITASHRPVVAADAPLARFLPESAREPIVRRIELGPLPAVAADRIVRATLGPGLPATVAAALRDRAEGNPFFLSELVRLVASKSGGGGSDLIDLSRHGIPSGVREVVQRRLAGVGDDVVQLLVLAAVAGASFSVPVLEAVAAMDSGRLLDALEEAAAARLIEEVPGSYGRYRFLHSLVRDAVYGGVSTVRRARLHGAVGRALERLEADDGGHLSELAFHYLVAAPDAGVDRAIEYGRQAAEQAARTLAFEEAARIYGSLLELLDRSAPDDVRRTALALGRAAALVRSGDVGAARDAFRALAVEAEARRDTRLLAEAALGFGQAFEAQARDEELIGLLEAALVAVPADDDGRRSRLLARLAAAQYFIAPGDRRDALSQAAVDAAVRSGDEGVVSQALSTRYFALWDADHLQERRTAATEALRLAERTGNGELELDALTWTVMDGLEVGDGPGADVAMARHTELAERLRHARHRSYALTWRGLRAFLDGRLADAEAAARQAFAVGDRLSPLAQARYGAQLFFIRREQGRLVELSADAERIVAEHVELRAGWLCLLAHVKLAAGDVARARQLYDEVMARMDQVPFDANWLVVQAQAAELCAAIGDAPQAATLEAVLERYADRCAVIRFGPGCLGAVARYAGLLAEMRGDPDRACAWFEQALGLNRRLRAATWVAHTQHDYARVLVARGRPADRSRAAELRADALASARRLGLDTLVRAIELPPPI